MLYRSSTMTFPVPTDRNHGFGSVPHFAAHARCRLKGGNSAEERRDEYTGMDGMGWGRFFPWVELHFSSPCEAGLCLTLCIAWGKKEHGWRMGRHACVRWKAGPSIGFNLRIDRQTRQRLKNAWLHPPHYDPSKQMQIESCRLILGDGCF